MTDAFIRKGQTALLKFKEEVSGIRANQAAAGLVENILVDYYGQRTPVKHIGSISVLPPRELAIQIWDAGAVRAVAAAIELSDLGVSVSADKNFVRVHLPELSGERREELVKRVKKMAEQCRIQVRALRDEANKEIVRSSMSEDDQFSEKAKVQKETEKFNKEIEDILNSKIAAIKS